MVNDRIGPSPGAVNSNGGHWYVQGNSQGLTYDGTLCTAEVFVIDQDTGVCSRWDGSTAFPAGVTLQNNKLKTSTGIPVVLGAAPVDGSPLDYIEFGVCAIKSACAANDTVKGAPYKGAANGQVGPASATNASSTDKMVCRLLDFQDKNAGVTAAGGPYAWFFWTGYLLNTNDVD